MSVRIMTAVVHFGPMAPTKGSSSRLTLSSYWPVNVRTRPSEGSPPPEKCLTYSGTAKRRILDGADNPVGRLINRVVGKLRL